MGDKERIETLEIYKFIKDYLPLVPILKLKKGQYLFRADYKDPTLFYIVSGRNEFMGAISSVHNADFQCSGIATTSMMVLALKRSLLDELMQSDEFSAFFYQKTSKRVYMMYKKILAKSLFSLREIFANYILEKRDRDEL